MRVILEQFNARKLGHKILLRLELSLGKQSGDSREKPSTARASIGLPGYLYRLSTAGKTSALLDWHGC
jgi:hypothetical protein